LILPFPYLLRAISPKLQAGTILIGKERIEVATVLVVDDDEHQRLLYQEELELEGHEVLLATSGPEAVATVADCEVDVVVLDIAMPGMDGVETLSRILDIDRQLPVILNTAYSSYKDDFMTWAADAYVTKSSDLSTLKGHVREALHQREQAQPGRQGTKE